MKKVFLGILVLAVVVCASLMDVKINAHQSYIPYGAFANCNALEWVIVPAIVDVTDSAFAACDNLQTVYYSGTDREYDYYVNENHQYSIGAESNDNPANGYGNKYYMAAKLCIYSDEPNIDGAHWHYNADGKPEVWTA